MAKMSKKSIAKISGAGILALVLLFCALGPAKLQIRTGLGWQFDHVIGYFGFTVMFCLAWPRPFVVGAALAAAAFLLEALQALTPDRCCDFDAAIISVGGALAGALAASLCLRWQRRNSAGTGPATSRRGCSPWLRVNPPSGAAGQLTIAVRLIPD
jgi:hypothetical protein